VWYVLVLGCWRYRFATLRILSDFARRALTSIFGWGGHRTHLFCAGAHPVLGIGLDYAFTCTKPPVSGAVLIGVSPSALTTLLGFGLPASADARVMISA
jgi:predicted exporter